MLAIATIRYVNRVSFDVGSCGSLFDGIDGIDVTPIDLRPHEGDARVLQCDFLELEVGVDGSAARIDASADFPAGTLRSLPARSYDVVVMSLVLSYVPLPSQRAEMVAKARELLSPPLDTAAPPLGQPCRARRGLLLLVDTFAVDRKARSWREQHYLQQWVSVVEELGFTFLRHQLLERSHALAFASRRADHPITLGGSKLAASAGGGTPALLMRSEHESVCSISSTYNPPRRPRRASE